MTPPLRGIDERQFVAEFKRNRTWQIAQLAAILSAGQMSTTGGTMIDAVPLVEDAAHLLDAARKFVDEEIP